MSVANRNKKKRKKEQQAKSIKVGSFESTGIIFQKVAHTKKNLRTDVHSWPSCVIAGYDDSKRSIFIDYNYSDENNDQLTKDIHEISAFFNEMKTQTSFTILNASYDDSIGKPTKTIEGTYKFLSYDNGRISAEKQEALDKNFVMKRLIGKNFSRPLQYEKETELKSNNKVSSITNFLNHPRISDLNIQIGDAITPTGTSSNDHQYIVLDIIEHNDGSEEIKVSPEITENENRIGKITKFDIYRKKIPKTSATLEGSSTGIANVNNSGDQVLGNSPTVPRNQLDRPSTGMNTARSTQPPGGNTRSMSSGY